MIRRLAIVVISCAAATVFAGSVADEEVTLVIPGIQCNMCVEKISTVLKSLDASVRVGPVGTETKQMPVTYDSAKVTLHQVVQAVAETPPVHGRPYQGAVVVTIEDPAKSASKVQSALKRVKGLVNIITPPGAMPGDIAIVLAPLPRSAKPTDHVKATTIGEALEKSGVKFSGLPSGSDAAGEPDPKKKPASGKANAKTKGNPDEPAEKTKPPRSAPSAPKSRPVRDAAEPKETDDGDKPRFEVIGGAGGKVYLVDRETKSEDGKELKKFVKVGDEFGDYVVKEIGDDEGLFVVLEHAETKETVRVERERKDKDKDDEKPKDEKD